MTQIGKGDGLVTARQKKILELYGLGPVLIRASKKGPFRICPDGTVYKDEGRGWRKLGKLEKDQKPDTLDNAMGRAA